MRSASRCTRAGGTHGIPPPPPPWPARPRTQPGAPDLGTPWPHRRSSNQRMDVKTANWWIQVGTVVPLPVLSRSRSCARCRTAHALHTLVLQLCPSSNAKLLSQDCRKHGQVTRICLCHLRLHLPEQCTVRKAQAPVHAAPQGSMGPTRPGTHTPNHLL